jgi:hypothetical protein
MIVFCIFILQNTSCVSSCEWCMGDGKNVYPAQVVILMCIMLAICHDM